MEMFNRLLSPSNIHLFSCSSIDKDVDPLNQSVPFIINQSDFRVGLGVGYFQFSWTGFDRNLSPGPTKKLN